MLAQELSRAVNQNEVGRAVDLLKYLHENHCEIDYVLEKTVHLNYPRGDVRDSSG